LEPLIAKVLGVVPVSAQPLDDAHIHAHVREEAHLCGYRV